jgi:hypothetical protein
MFVPKSCLVSSVSDDIEKINNVVRFNDHFTLSGPISVTKCPNIFIIGELKSRVDDSS